MKPVSCCGARGEWLDVAGVTDFYEEDETVDKIVNAFDDGQQGVTGIALETRTYACEHMTVTGPLVSATCGVGCELARVETR